MGQKSIKGSLEFAKQIKLRRNELNLTIEEAAKKAGVGTKTWSRYEAGESIRKDKYKGVCKALNWRAFPNENEDMEDILNVSEYKSHEAWSKYIEEVFGEAQALSFAIGSDILLDYLDDDIEALSSLPAGSHIGQIGISFIAGDLPPQFLMRYDYEFLYAMRTTIIRLRKIANAGTQIIAHSVMEELALYLIVEESRFFMEGVETNIKGADGWDDWIYDVFDDVDLLTFLYSGLFWLEKDHTYHFDNWMAEQFYCS